MSKGRRDAGDGALYPRKDGRWAGSFLIVKNGRHVRKYVYGKTKAEAREKLRRAQNEYEQGTLVTAPTQSVQAYLEYWLKVQQTTLKVGAFHAYQRYIRIYITPYLGQIKLQKLSTDALQHWISQLQEQGLANSTIRYCYGILSSALQDALEWRKIVFHPGKGVKLPRVTKYDGPVLDPEQARHLMEMAADRRIACLIILALATGMRRGELLALHWEDINIEEKRLLVKRTVSYLPDSQGRHRFVETEPKSETSRRSITLPQFACDALRAHKKRQNEERLSAGQRWQNRDLVFCTLTGGYSGLHGLHSQFKKLLQDAGLPDMRIHDLRHSAATILLTMGVHPKVVQELLGHSSITITLTVYSHVLPSLQRSAMDELDGLFLAAKRG